jgi:hypothetical protein
MKTMMNFRKPFVAALATVIFAACSAPHDPVAGAARSETGNDIIKINVGTGSMDYEKVSIKGHDCWIRYWSTKYGTGSDILHIEDLCGKCSGKSGESGDPGDGSTLDY